MPVGTLYPSKPVACWPKMKELRREHHRRNQRTMDKGGVVVVGIAEEFLSLLAGIGEYATWQYEPRFTACMRDPQLAIQNLESLEGYGFGRDLCNSLRVHMGGVLLGHLEAALGGKKPDFVFQWELCPFSIKTAQWVGERLGVPWVTLDCIDRYRMGAVDFGYMLDQMTESIERMEQITGRPYDDERFLAAVRNEWECCVLWAEICDLTRAVPAPIDYRHCQSLRIPMIVDRDKPEVVAFYRELYDEVKERVAGGISARGFEDARVLFEGFQPFHTIGMMRWPERYGAITVGGGPSFSSFGAWSVLEDGTWTPAKRWWERGNPLRTREDGLRALVDLYIGDEHERRSYPSTIGLRTRPQQMVRRVEDWKAGGVVLGMERRCRISYLAQVEQMTVMQEHGIPCVEFEPSSADPREFDEVQVSNRICAFLEGMGLQKRTEGDRAEEPD